MIKDFVKEGTLYALTIAVAKGISLLLVPVFTYYFATKDFGVLEILNVIAFLATGLFSWQFGQGIVRYLGADKDHEKRRKYLASTALIFVIGSFVVGTALLVVFRMTILKAIGLSNPVYEKTFILAMCTMLFNGVFFFLASHMQALRKKNNYALSLFLHAFMGICSTYFFVILLDKSVNGYFYATLLTTPMVIVYQFKVLKSEFVLGFSKTILIELLKFSGPLIPSTLALILLSVIDRIILNDLTSTSTLGIYSIGVKFSFGLQLLIQGYASAISPLIFQNQLDSETPKQLSVLFRGYVILGCFVILLLTLFAKETIYFFAQSPYHSAYLVLPMLYSTAWLHGLVMFAPGMQIKKRTLYITVIASSAVFLNIYLNYLLIPIFDMKGAALAGMIAAVVYVVLFHFVSFKLYPIPFKFLDWIVVLFLVSFILFFSTSRIESIFAQIPIVFKLGIGIIYLTLLGLYFRKFKRYM